MPEQTRLTFPAATPRPGTPAWTMNQLQNPNTSIRTTVQLQPCPTCAALTLTGYDGPILAHPARADPHTVPTHLWDLYETAGRTLYQLAATETTWRLIACDGPAHGLTIIPAHRCGHPPPHGRPVLTPPTHQPKNQPPPF